LDLEPGLITVLEANLSDGVQLIQLGEFIREAGVLPPAQGDSDLVAVPSDPHLWMDARIAARYGAAIRDGLRAIDPGSSTSYGANYDRYAASLEDLRSYAVERIDAIPHENRKLVTTHEAFYWFASGLGLEAVAVVAESPGQEPSPQEIANLRAAIDEQNIPAVFTEPQISEESEILEQAADDAGVLVCRLYSDSLDDEVSTYIEMMRFNADELARCLGG
jgi:ABC-type Zn uptake system ZnuABC Zn-binding protein ZnuA